MANIKVSELPTATRFDDDDYVMIIQSNTNKKITKQNMYGNYIYSTNESIIGKWIDDKPLYRKIINIGQYTWNNGDHTFAHNVNNIDTVLKVQWIGHYNNKWYYSWDELTTQNITVNTSDVILDCTSSGATFDNNYLIVEYTKTTD